MHYMNKLFNSTGTLNEQEHGRFFPAKTRFSIISKNWYGELYTEHV